MTITPIWSFVSCRKSWFCNALDDHQRVIASGNRMLRYARTAGKGVAFEVQSYQSNRLIQAMIFINDSGDRIGARMVPNVRLAEVNDNLLGILFVIKEIYEVLCRAKKS